jgi:hypothetical protein
MPVIIDASDGFDRAGLRYSARPDGSGLPARLLTHYYLRRSFRSVDEVGAEGTEWAVLRISARIYSAAQSQATDNGREGAVTDFTLATNSGAINHLDQIASDEGWWRLPARSGRDVWVIDGDPYPVQTAGGAVHHYEVPVRRVDG